jgi:Tfp pilus assembly protein PilZ
VDESVQGAGQELRRTPRRPFVLRVTGSRVFGTTENLSKGGMFLQTEEALAIGESIVTTPSFPGLLDPEQVSGIVVRRRAKAPGLPGGVGIAFTNDSAATIPALVSLLQDTNRRLTPNRPPTRSSFLPTGSWLLRMNQRLRSSIDAPS